MSLADRLGPPNPLWLREMQQSARLTRTPFVLMSVTMITGLFLCAVGGMAVAFDAQADAIGLGLYQAFFSVAFFVVTLVGPAVAANSIASEREGRTWEALQLTGLPPAQIARGKFWAVYTSIASYIIAMAPLGALPFLFGGVTATEVLLAFGWLFVIAALSVAFGLAISARMQSVRASILITMMIAIVVSPVLFLTLGVAMSYTINDVWPQVTKGLPVWLPTAYQRAPFGVDYASALLLAPAISILLPAWFFYEVTLSSLTSITDDRSTGLRRWFVVASLAVLVGACVLVASVRPNDRAPVHALTLFLLHVFAAFFAFVIAGEPIGPSRRVQLGWQRAGAGAFTRFLGPGVVRAAATTAAVSAALFAVTSALSVALIMRDKTGDQVADAIGALVVCGYAISFTTFLAGFVAAVRARTGSPSTTRVLLVVAVFFTAAGPWIAAAIAGAITSSSNDNDMMVAAPSPFYGVFVAANLRHAPRLFGPGVVASLAACTAWLLLGLGLFALARARSHAIIAAHEAALAESDATLAAEDEAERAASQGPSSDLHEGGQTAVDVEATQVDRVG